MFIHYLVQAFGCRAQAIGLFPLASQGLLGSESCKSCLSIRLNHIFFGSNGYAMQTLALSVANASTAPLIKHPDMAQIKIHHLVAVMATATITEVILNRSVSVLAHPHGDFGNEDQRCK